MTTLSLANSHSRQRQRLTESTAKSARSLWRQLDDIRAWPSLLPRLLVALTGAQSAAAGQANAYTSAVLGDDGEGEVAAMALAGVASDGRPLASLLSSPEVAARIALTRGATMPRAMAIGEETLSRIVRTQVADAGRVADGVAIAARPGAGYVRMLVPPGDCSRCIVLAGRFYRYNVGFRRHPRCNCTHVPAREVDAADLRTDPRQAFDALSEAEQDRVFTKAGARAIRDGADISQVVNVRRSATGLTPAGARITAEEARMLRGGRDRGRLQTTNVFGREVFTSTEGTTGRGIAGQRLIAGRSGVVDEAGETVSRRSRSGTVQRQVTRQRAAVPRMMPESIYQFAESRQHAIALLHKFGYLT